MPSKRKSKPYKLKVRRKNPFTCLKINIKYVATRRKRDSSSIKTRKTERKKNHCLPSSEEIPVDIVIDILKRLPIKSLMKFMSVSKQWKSIIQSSSFVADYNRNIQPRNNIFVTYESEKYVDIFNADDDLDFLQRHTIRKQAHLRGLDFDCLNDYSQGLFAFACDKPKDVVIWNPSIRKSVRIPLHKSHWDKLGFTVCNATDPTVFSVTDKPHNNCVLLEIFSLSTREWRTLSNDAPRATTLELGTREVIDGFIHWIASVRTPEGKNKLILSCDLARQQFTELCLPPSLASPTSRAYLDLSTLRESLVVLETYDEREEEIGVWMMERPGGGFQNSFTKLFTINVPTNLSAMRGQEVLGFTKDGKPIIQIPGLCPNCRDCHFDELNLKLLIYEPHSKCFKDMEISEKSDACYAGSYRETLLLLDY